MGETWEYGGDTSLENVYLEDREGNETITLRCILGRWVVRMGSRRTDLGECPMADFGVGDF
jgi:hypothetical protein